MNVTIVYFNRPADWWGVHRGATLLFSGTFAECVAFRRDM